MSFDNDETTPSTDSDLKQATHNRVKIIDYDKLKDYNDIDELLPKPKSAFILLYEHAPNQGHWTVVGRDVDDNYFHFCSYGSDVDEPLNWTPTNVRAGLGAGIKHLSRLFNGREVLYNSTPFQDENSDEATCGEFSAFIVNQILSGKPFEEALINLEKLKQPKTTYAKSIVNYFNNHQ